MEVKIKNGFTSITGRSMKMSKGITFFSFLVFLVLLTSYAVAAECGCNACHGNPPVLTGVYGGPDGMVNPPTGSLTAGAHAKHAAPSGTSINPVCYKCHSNGMPYTPMCGNNKIQIGFDINGLSGTGTSYDGQILNTPYSYEGTKGTTVTTNNSKVCSNIYCHSDGTSVSTGVAPNGQSPAWDSAGGVACNSCHGNTEFTDYRKAAPNYAQDQPKANSHYRHQMFTCNYCHYPVTLDGTSIADSSKHLNGVYNVAPDPNALYYSSIYAAGIPVNFQYTYDIGGGKCFGATNTCHTNSGMTGDRNWGAHRLAISANWTPGTSCAEVKFTGSASNMNGCTPPYTYLWDFGDGTTSTEQNPTHIYPSLENFTVTLYARDANNHLGASAAMVVKGYQTNTPPVAKVSFVSLVGHTLTLRDESYDPDYNKCGHTGPGQISIKWFDPYNLTASTDASINLTDQPSNTTYSYTYNSNNNTPGQTIWLTDNITDNAGSKTYVTMGVQILETYSVSGSVVTNGVGLANVDITIRDKDYHVYGHTYTDSNGNFTAGSLIAGNCYYFADLYKTGYTFTPGTQEVCSATTNLNWTYSPPPPYTVSGTITHSGGSSFANCLVYLKTTSGTTVTTAQTTSTGSYSFTNIPADQSYNIVPSGLSGFPPNLWSFTPASITVTGPRSDANFVATP